MQLKEIHLKGFKSIDNQNGQDISFGKITLLLGANGCGKTNIVSFFRLLASLATGALQQHTAKQGAHTLLFYGPKVTGSLEFSVSVEEATHTDHYGVSLSYAALERLFVSSETVRRIEPSTTSPQAEVLSEGSSEAALSQETHPKNKALRDFFASIQTFQFHDTSDTARIKSRCYVDDASFLRSDAGNLAAFLKVLKESDTYNRYYKRIVSHIQRIMPQLNDFVLDTLTTNERYVRLNWTDRARPDYLFGPDQLSDGSLRFMALSTLLLQPPAFFPKVIVLDEPELGLHPAALVELAGLIKRASQHTQIIAATQSPRLIDEFSSEDIVVVERDPHSGTSTFRRLDTNQLNEWLQHYSLSELWEKNVLGGQP
ncbi:AAA family ATPase [Myxococcota bacterium]|nr:AAA family ATPase [Myxococcota bacterium]